MLNEDFFNRIKSKLSGIEPDFDPGDWAAMEAMLDRKKPIVPLRALRIAAGLALFVLGYLSYSYFSNAENTRQALSYSTAEKSGIAKAAAAAGAEKDHALPAMEKAPAAAQEGVALPKAAKSDAETLHPAMAGKNEAPVSLPAERDLETPGENPAAGMPGPALRMAEQKHDAVYDGSADLQSSLLEDPGESIRLVKKESPVIEAGENYVHRAMIPFEAMIPGTAKGQKSWWIGMTAVPGLQYVQNAKGSFARGLVAGMEFARVPLSFEAGILEDRYRYEEAPAARLYLGENHTLTEGTLSGISIPLKAKFYFGSKSRVQPFISTGLTAFIPVKEQYVFSFDMKNPKNLSQPSEARVVRDTFDLPKRQGGGIESAATFDFSSTGNVTLPDRQGMYLLASAGAGLNFQVNARLGFQMSANYSRSLGGMGLEQRNMKRIDLGMAMHYFIN